MVWFDRSLIAISDWKVTSASGVDDKFPKLRRGDASLHRVRDISFLKSAAGFPVVIAGILRIAWNESERILKQQTRDHGHELDPDESLPSRPHIENRLAQKQWVSD